MSDFLSHLAARAVSPVPVVRPLVRTPFEPHAAGELSFPAITDPVLRESPPLPDAPLPIQRTGTRDTPLPPVPDLPPPLAHHKTPSAVAAQPAKIPDAVKPLSKRLPASLVTTPAPAAATSRQPVTRPRVSLVISEAEFMVHDAAESRNAWQPPGVLHAVAKIPDVPSPANPPIRPRIETTTTRISQRSFPTRAEAPATPQPAPQVTITIGRVEIRAAAPAVQTPPPAESGPAVSLETYLRRSATRSA